MRSSSLSACRRGLFPLYVVLMVAGCATTGGRMDPGPANIAAEESLEVGEVAPPFELKRLDLEGGPVRLAAFRGEKPVILLFGSYT